MADKMMKVQFKTKTKAGGGLEPAGKVHTLPEAKAKDYIERGLAVEVKQTAKETEAEAKAEAESKAAAEKAAAKEAEKKAKAEAEKAGT